MICGVDTLRGQPLVHQMMMLDAELTEPVENVSGPDLVRRLVDRLLAELGMTELGDLQFFEAVDLSAPGWSFIQPITTSHISGHYFAMPDEPPRIHLDIYSCRPFDPGKTIASLHTDLSFGRWVGTLVVRDMDLTRRSTMELEGYGDQIAGTTPLRPRPQALSSRRYPCGFSSRY